jgi:hypothetical protein
MHAHVAAMRYAVKVLLRDLWVAWLAIGMSLCRTPAQTQRGCDVDPDKLTTFRTHRDNTRPWRLLDLPRLPNATGFLS